MATRRDMARSITLELGIPVSLARKVIELVLGEIASGLIHSGRVEFRGFGSFTVEKRKPKRVRLADGGVDSHSREEGGGV